jgi:hypothetical protein
MLEVATQDYVRTARAKGVPERRVVLRHQLRNALLTSITRFGLAFPFLLTGAVLIETIFAWPGMGRLAFNAILSRDYPLVTATALIASIVVVLGNLLADILLGIADPRLRVRASADVEVVTALRSARGSRCSSRSSSRAKPYAPCATAGCVRSAGAASSAIARPRGVSESWRSWSSSRWRHHSSRRSIRTGRSTSCISRTTRPRGRSCSAPTS